MRLMLHLRALVVLTALANSVPVQGLELVCPMEGRATAVHECCCLLQNGGLASVLDDIADCCCQLRPAFQEAPEQTPAKLPTKAIGDDLGHSLTPLVAVTPAPQSFIADFSRPSRSRRSAPLFLQYRSLLI